MNQDRDQTGGDGSPQRAARNRRRIDCAGRPGWLSEEPEIVVRERVTIVEPHPRRTPPGDAQPGL